MLITFINLNGKSFQNLDGFALSSWVSLGKFSRTELSHTGWFRPLLT